ncbi:MAG: DUF2723 domain-containing protein [Patescibacteria group bacterium]|nr:DUF2723 domain-containing protein [Patescibacteria group bacterium]
MKKLLPHLPFLLPLWILSLAIYIKTMPPSILYIDSGTLVAAAAELGIPNPPGFPTYVLLAHFFTKIPWGTILFRVQLLSVVSALGVLTLVYFQVLKLISLDFWFAKKGVDDRHLFGGGIFSLKQTLPWPPLLTKVCAVGSALALSFSYQFWSQTLNTESYIFTNFLMISLLYLLLTVPQGGKGMGKRLFLGAVILGLATGANPTIVQIVPALFLGGLFLRRHFSLVKLIPTCLVAVIVVAAVYAYLPLRAAQHPFLNWGDPQTWDLFWGQIHGVGLNIYDPRTNSINGFTGSSTVFVQSIGRYLYLLFVQFTPLLLPLVALGIFYLFQKNKRLFWVLIVIPLTNLLFGGLYLSGNQESWFISSYIIFSLFLGIGLSFILKLFLNIGTNSKNRELRIKFLILASLFLVLIPLIWWFPKLDRSNHWVTTEYADNLYSNLPKGAVLIGSGDFFNSMANYEYDVLGKRDVFPVVANMWYILPWYRDNLRHQRPDLMPQELEGMIKKDRLEEYNEVMNWYIRWLIDHGHPVYVTPMVFRETVLAGTDAGKYVPDKNKVRAVENGLTYRMLTPDDLLQPSEDFFKYKFRDPNFFKNPPFYLERNYNAAYNLLLREYGLGYASLADYFLSNSKEAPELKGKAEEYIKKAYDIAPFSAEIVNRLAIFSAMQGNLAQAVQYFKQAIDLEPESWEIRINLAKALEAAGQIDEAKKTLQTVLDQADNSQLKNDAQQELAKLNLNQLSANVPRDWKLYESKDQEYSFRYPADWKLNRQDGILTIISGDGFSVSFYGGVTGKNPEEWVSQDPLKFSGKMEKKGPAQIPGFTAMAAFWTETDSKKALEFILSQGKHVLHLKVKPTDNPQMKNLDQILSTIKFLD